MPEENKTAETTQYPLNETQVEILNHHAFALQNFYVLIGQQFCELMNNVSQTKEIEKNINDLQEDIAKELGLPRANKLAWNLSKKYVEVIS